MGLCKQFSPEFEREAVQLLESGSRPASELAREWAFPAIISTNGRLNSGHAGVRPSSAQVCAKSGPRRSPA